jgi:hypothetical protein
MAHLVNDVSGNSGDSKRIHGLGVHAQILDPTE